MISKCVFRKTYGFNKNRIHEFLTLCESKFVNHFAVRAEFKAMVKWPDYTQRPMFKDRCKNPQTCSVIFSASCGKDIQAGQAGCVKLIAATRYCRYVAIPELLQPPAPQAR